MWVWRFCPVFLLLLGAPAFASNCEGSAQRLRIASIGEVINIQQKMKINAVCSRKMKLGGKRAPPWSVLGLEFVAYPRDVFKVVSTAYSFAFSASRVGSFQIRYRYKVRSNAGAAEGYINYVMDVDVVPTAW